MKYCFVGIAGLFLTLTACKNESEPGSISTSEITFTKEGSLRITDSLESDKGRYDIEIADDDYERETGLMYRRSMEDDQGMLFIFEDEELRYFYMKNTHIPLDLIFINADKEIVSIHASAEPMNETSIPSREKAMYVLEVNSGQAVEKTIDVGDRIEFSLDH